MKKTGNKGFSLIELVIVIAIMAVLVGILAPQLMRYIERSKVAADQDMLESLNHAIVFAATDPAVQEDAASLAVLNTLVANPATLESIPSGNLFYDEICRTMSWPDLNQSTYLAILESYHTSNTHVYLQFKGGVLNPMAIWFTQTDVNGYKDPDMNDPTIWTDLDNPNCHLICIR